MSDLIGDRVYISGRPSIKTKAGEIYYVISKNWIFRRKGEDLLEIIEFVSSNSNENLGACVSHITDTANDCETVIRENNEKMREIESTNASEWEENIEQDFMIMHIQNAIHRERLRHLTSIVEVECRSTLRRNRYLLPSGTLCKIGGYNLVWIKNPEPDQKCNDICGPFVAPVTPLAPDRLRLGIEIGSMPMPMSRIYAEDHTELSQLIYELFYSEEPNCKAKSFGRLGEMAMLGNCTRSMFWYGRMLSQSKIHYNTGLLWYWRSAVLGDAEAQYYLSSHYKSIGQTMKSECMLQFSAQCGFLFSMYMNSFNKLDINSRHELLFGCVKLIGRVEQYLRYEVASNSNVFVLSMLLPGYISEPYIPTSSLEVDKEIVMLPNMNEESSLGVLHFSNGVVVEVNESYSAVKIGELSVLIEQDGVRVIISTLIDSFEGRTLIEKTQLLPRKEVLLKSKPIIYVVWLPDMSEYVDCTRERIHLSEKRLVTDYYELNQIDTTIAHDTIARLYRVASEQGNSLAICVATLRYLIPSNSDSNLQSVFTMIDHINKSRHLFVNFLFPSETGVKTEPIEFDSEYMCSFRFWFGLLMYSSYVECDMQIASQLLMECFWLGDISARAHVLDTIEKGLLFLPQEDVLVMFSP